MHRRVVQLTRIGCFSFTNLYGAYTFMIPNLFAQDDAPKAQSSRYFTKRSEFVVLESDNNTAANGENARHLLPFCIFPGVLSNYSAIQRYVVL